MPLLLRIVLVAKLKAQEIIKIFLIIYCPSRVGTNHPCHVTDGTITSGIKVVIRWSPKRVKAIFSSLGSKNKTPTNTSNIPNQKINWLNVMKGIVFSNRLLTNGFAGLIKIIFKNPNQPYTKKSATLSNHKLMRSSVSMPVIIPQTNAQRPP